MRNEQNCIKTKSQLTKTNVLLNKTNQIKAYLIVIKHGIYKFNYYYNKGYSQKSTSTLRIDLRDYLMFSI